MEDNLLYFFDLFGTFIFAMTGAIKGVKNRLDILGVVVFAITVGCAGGIVRDLMLGAVPVGIYKNSLYVFLCVIAALFIFLISPKVVGRWSLLNYFDAIGLGVFTALGCSKAAQYGVNSVGILMSGVFTACGGGILRDVFSKEIPMVFTSDFYASASILGALIYLLLRHLGVDGEITLWACAILTIASRIVGFKCHLKLPVAKIPDDENKK